MQSQNQRLKQIIQEITTRPAVDCDSIVSTTTALHNQYVTHATFSNCF